MFMDARGSLNVVLDGVICRGEETSLFDCAHTGIGMNACERSEIAAVHCEGIVCMVFFVLLS